MKTIKALQIGLVICAGIAGSAQASYVDVNGNTQTGTVTRYYTDEEGPGDFGPNVRYVRIETNHAVRQGGYRPSDRLGNGDFEATSNLEPLGNGIGGLMTSVGNTIGAIGTAAASAISTAVSTGIASISNTGHQPDSALPVTPSNSAQALANAQAHVSETCSSGQLAATCLIARRDYLLIHATQVGVNTELGAALFAEANSVIEQLAAIEGSSTTGSNGQTSTGEPTPDADPENSGSQSQTSTTVATDDGSCYITNTCHDSDHGSIAGNNPQDNSALIGGSADTELANLSAEDQALLNRVLSPEERANMTSESQLQLLADLQFLQNAGTQIGERYTQEEFDQLVNGLRSQLRTEQMFNEARAFISSQAPRSAVNRPSVVSTDHSFGHAMAGGNIAGRSTDGSLVVQHTTGGQEAAAYFEGMFMNMAEDVSRGGDAR